MPVYIGNDASCAAFGEKTLNPSADVDNLMYVYSDVGAAWSSMVMLHRIERLRRGDADRVQRASVRRE